MISKKRACPLFMRAIFVSKGTQFAAIIKVVSLPKFINERAYNIETRFYTRNKETINKSCHIYLRN